MRFGLKLLRRNPAYRTFWLAELVSLVGDWFSIVAVSVVSAERGGASSALALAGVLAAHLLPQAAFSPVAGWLADRLDRKRLLVASSLGEGMVTLAMVAAATREAVWALGLLLLFRSVISAVREPALGAALPRIVAPADLQSANAFGAATWSTTFVVGMALGGLATEVGPAFALAVDAATFFLAAALLRALPALPPSAAFEVEGDAARETAPSLGVHIRAVGRDLLRAANLARRPPLRAAVFMKTPIALLGGASWMALNLTSRDVAFAGGAAATLGLLQAVRGAGTGVGPALVPVFGRRGVSPRTIATLSAVAAAIGAVTLSLGAGPIAAVLGALLWGIGGGASWVLSVTDIQQLSPDGYRGRLLAIDAFGFSVAMSAGALLMAVALAAHVALTHAALGVSVLSILGWLLVYRGNETPAAEPAPAVARR